MTREAWRARVAVSVLFLLNGAAFANLVPRYPEIKAGFGLTNSGFALLVVAYPVGALIIGLAGGAIVAWLGSARVAWGSVVVLSLNLVLIGFAPSAWIFALGLFFAGGLDAAADTAANAHGLRVERAVGRSVLNSMHGLWSVGAVIGGAMGAASAGLAIPVRWQLAAAAVVFVGIALAASRGLLRGPDDAVSATPRPGRARVGLLGVLLALGVIAASANIVEDVAATWSAVYLRESLGSALAVAGFGFIAMQAAQTVGRFVGDPLVTRFGDRAVARAGASVALIAMTVVLVFPSVIGTVVAFGLVGTGIGTLIPAAIRAAEARAELSTGSGITAVTSVIRVGLLVSPLAVGAVADLASLRVALAVIPIAALAILLLSRMLPRAAVQGAADGPAGRDPSAPLPK